MVKIIKKQPKKAGRPKGSKSGLPFTTFSDAIEYAKKIWEKAQYKEMPFFEICKFMSLHPQKAVRVLNSLKDFYGVVEKLENGNWRLTDTGKRIVRNDYLALKEVFSKNQMFGELLNTFLGKDVTEGTILHHIQKNYKGTDAAEARQRFLEGIQIIQNASENQLTNSQKESQIATLPLFQLKYALIPPSKQEIEDLVDKAVETLIKTNDETLKLIAELMLEKKKDEEELKSLLQKAMKKLNLNTNENDVQEKLTEDDKPKQA